jgi:hypothetical protein
MLFAAFFAATRHPPAENWTGRISFNGHFAVARFRLPVRFTLGTRAETLQAAGRRWRTKLYVDFVSIARGEHDVGHNGPGP